MHNDIMINCAKVATYNDKYAVDGVINIDKIIYPL